MNKQTLYILAAFLLIFSGVGNIEQNSGHPILLTLALLGSGFYFLWKVSND